MNNLRKINKSESFYNPNKKSQINLHNQEKTITQALSA